MDSYHSNNDEELKKRRSALAASVGMWKDRDDLDWLTERKDRVLPGWSDREPEPEMEAKS